MQTYKILMEEFDAISERDRLFKIRKMQEILTHIHTDGRHSDRIAGPVEYQLPNGERLQILDRAHPDAPNLFERTTTFEHLRVI